MPGAITVVGGQVALVNAHLDASGPSGGSIRIGGDWQGLGTLPRSQFTFADATSTLSADAIAGGNGGTIVLWAEDTTRVQSVISARGDRGGQVETSGQRSLDVTGARVDASGSRGGAGIWLLDPGNLRITNGATTVGVLPLFAPGAADSTVNAGAIAKTLDAGTNVVLTTAGATAGFGDITLAGSITKTATNGAALTLTGRRFIQLGNSQINLANGGDVTFNLNQVNPEAVATTDSLQAALDATSTGGGMTTVNLGAGTYSGNTIQVNKNVTIAGAGMGDTILSGGGLRRSCRYFEHGSANPESSASYQ